MDDYVFLSSDGDLVNLEVCLDSIKCSPESTPALSLVKPEHDSDRWEENERSIPMVKKLLSHCLADCDYDTWRSIVWAVCSLN